MYKMAKNGEVCLESVAPGQPRHFEGDGYPSDEAGDGIVIDTGRFRSTSTLQSPKSPDVVPPEQRIPASAQDIELFRRGIWRKANVAIGDILRTPPGLKVGASFSRPK